MFGMPFPWHCIGRMPPDPPAPSGRGDFTGTSASAEERKAEATPEAAVRAQPNFPSARDLGDLAGIQQASLDELRCAGLIERRARSGIAADGVSRPMRRVGGEHRRAPRAGRWMARAGLHLGDLQHDFETRHDADEHRCRQRPPQPLVRAHGTSCVVGRMVARSDYVVI